MADGFVQPPVDTGVGKKVDCEELLVGGVTVERQRIVLQHPTSTYHKVAAASTNPANVKATPAQVYSLHAFSIAAYPVYVKLYDKATPPTVGTDVPVMTIGVQAGVPRDIVMPGGETFTLGLAIAIVKGIADNDATAVALNDCVVDVVYK